MAQPFDYRIQQPQVSSYFDAFRQGRSDQRQMQAEQRSDALAQYLPGALKGDAGMRDQALESASADQQISLSNTFAQMDAQTLAKTKESQSRVASLAAWADTPEKWTVANAEAKKIFPGSPDIPFEQRVAVIAKAQTVSEQLDQVWKQKSYDLDASRTKAQNAQSYAAADASSASAEAARRKPVNGVDPASGVRVAPPGVQVRDTAQLQRYEQDAAAFAGIASTLQSAERALKTTPTGPGTGIARMVASPLSVLGIPGAAEFAADYDAIDQASKVSGIEKLKGIGGSDTERELMVAIQTGIGTETPGPENARRFKDAIVAADIASKKAQFATEWTNKVGSLTYTAPNGMSWPQFWSEYQKAAWKDHIATRDAAPADRRPNFRDDQRRLLNTPRSSGPGYPPPPPGSEIIK